MTNATRARITHWIGRDVRDPVGEKIGSVEQLWFDDEDGSPTWVSVRTGLFGLRQSFLPIQGLTEGPDGELRTTCTKDQVKDAPSVDASDEHLDPAEEQRLYSHYGVTGGAGRQERADTGRADTGQRASAGHDVSGPDTDDAMTRSEERLRVGTEQHEAGRVRLRKYVVTETEQVSVPVRREEVRVEREPITGANRGAALSGPDISEEEHEVTLREERPVVETEAVPVERVRLAKEQVTDTETVSGEVRKERIDTEGDVPGARRDSGR
ncbi:uncharacterized protein (TIGR02271 family) [Saccharothrix coeruleofusca]|uniref:DUF2382 domain-containing protein n=1 Tax=Saccharothrix coeruleofusca TaxID=33919 RepID=UPI001AEAAC65|nr:PRC and DUF2382 domain-containing protein [Saccharothrix coeruleofusca]MBP2335007.1 uncharacterized protein (TIGR02271 family) [Saccharothrix coeruleofusca]